MGVTPCNKLHRQKWQQIKCVWNRKERKVSEEWYKWDQNESESRKPRWKEWKIAISELWFLFYALILRNSLKFFTTKVWKPSWSLGISVNPEIERIFRSDFPHRQNEKCETALSKWFTCNRNLSVIMPLTPPLTTLINCTNTSWLESLKKLNENDPGWRFEFDIYNDAN